MPKLTLQKRKAELQQQIIRQTADLNAATGAMQMLDILIAAEQEPPAAETPVEPPATGPAPAEFPTPSPDAD
jgi:hypothetical protein